MLSEQSATIPTVMAAKSRLGVAVRKRDADAEQEARRDLAAANIAAHIRRVVDSAPPLTHAQCSELATLLSVGGRDAQS